jgi:hypothetical protein
VESLLGGSNPPNSTKYIYGGFTLMIEIFEIETFKLPDGTEYEIIPLITEDIDLLLDFGQMMGDKADLEQALKQITANETPKGTRAKKKLTDAQVAKEQEKFIKENTELLKKILPIADNVINKGTNKEGNIESDEDGNLIPDPFPVRYRSVKNRIDLCTKIGTITMGTMEEVDKVPLSQKAQNK